MAAVCSFLKDLKESGVRVFVLSFGIEAEIHEALGFAGAAQHVRYVCVATVPMYSAACHVDCAHCCTTAAMRYHCQLYTRGGYQYELLVSLYTSC